MVCWLASSKAGFGQTMEGTEAGKGKASGIYKNLEEHNYTQATERIAEYGSPEGKMIVTKKDRSISEATYTGGVRQ